MTVNRKTFDFFSRKVNLFFCLEIIPKQFIHAHSTCEIRKITRHQSKDNKCYLSFVFFYIETMRKLPLLSIHQQETTWTTTTESATTESCAETFNSTSAPMVLLYLVPILFLFRSASLANLGYKIVCQPRTYR